MISYTNNTQIFAKQEAQALVFSNCSSQKDLICEHNHVLYIIFLMFEVHHHLHHHHASVHCQYLPCNVRGGISGKEGNRFGDIFGFAETLQRYLF